MLISLPQDTRSTEIISSLALIGLSLFLFAGVTTISKLVLIQSIWFWAVLFLVLGILQFFSIELYPRAETLRVIMAWVNGSLWIWLSLQTALNLVGASDICAFFIGLGNLYAFCMNSLLIKKQWAI